MSKFWGDAFSKNNIKGTMGNIVGGIGSAVGGAMGDAIRGGFDDGGIGSGIQNIGGQIGSAIPGPIGGIVSAGSGLIGGFFSRMFGVKENKENTGFIKGNSQNALNAGNTLAASSTTGDLMSNASKMVGSSGFRWNDLYQNGWFTSKGTRLGSNLIAKEKSDLAFQSHGLATGAENVDYNMDRNVMRNFAAFGGPLGINTGALNYEFMNDYLMMKNNQKNNDGITNPNAGVSPEFFAEGGNIEIKHPGRLTALKKRTGKTEAELYNDGNPAHKKMVVFARNARKWKKAFGGYLDAAEKFYTADNNLANEFMTEEEAAKAADNSFIAKTLFNTKLPIGMKATAGAGINPIAFANMYGKMGIYGFGGDLETHGGDYPTKLTHVDAGDSHELNPNGGVQIGKDQEGIPNLVEEGEVIYDDYVFSNRISVDDVTKEKFHLNKKKDLTYADLAKKFEKSIKETPNDPISQASFKAKIQSLQEQQERQKQEMETQRAREAFESLSPKEQVAVMQKQAIQEQAAQEAAVQQEAVAQQQAQEQMAAEQQMQQPIEAPIVEQPQVQAEGGNIETNEFSDGGIINKHFIINDDGTYSEIGEDALEGLELQDNIDKEVDDNNQTIYKYYYKKPVEQTRAAETPEITEKPEKDTKEKDTTEKRRYNALRYTGLFGPVTGMTMMATGVGRPNYSGLNNALAIASEGANQATFTPIGNYLKYSPMDIWSEQNRLNQNARATDRTLLNSAGPARMAGILASGYNNQLASGELFKKALEYNDAKRAQVSEFNRGTDQYNSQMGAHTSAQNAHMNNQARQFRASLAADVARQKLENEAGWYNSLYGNINSMFKGLGDLGREREQRAWLKALGEADALKGVDKVLGRAEGGKIKKNKGRGLTF